MYDLIIIGGGPAAIGAGVYAARKKLKILLIAESLGGQSIVSNKIENWIGEVAISGFELAEKLEKHLRAHPDIEVKSPEKAVRVEKIANNTFNVFTEQGGVFQSKAVIVASGGHRKRLGIPGEDAFDGKGVAFCSTCDAPLFAGKDVVVVGGGNSALESVIDLFAYVKKIYLIVRGDKLRGDPVSQEKIKANANVEIIYNTESRAITGDTFVTGFTYFDKIFGAERTIHVSGVFVEIGSVPNSEMVKGLVETNASGEIMVDRLTAATSCAGVFAAGDVSNEIYKQNNISVSEGIRSALSAYGYILNHKK